MLIISSLILLLISVHVSNGFTWFLVTRSLGSPANLLDTLTAWLVSNLSRLIPGSVWQYPSRVYLQSRLGLTAQLSSIAVGLEIVNNLISGALIVLIGLAFGLGKDFQFSNIILLPVLVLCLILSLLPLFNHPLNIWTNLQLSRWFKFRLPTVLPLDLIKFIACTGFQFIACGSVLFLLQKYVGKGELVFSIWAYTVAWLLGFIAIFAPAGIGVQDGVLAWLLSRHLSGAQAVSVAISLRFVLLASELFTTLLLLTLSKKIGKLHPR